MAHKQGKNCTVNVNDMVTHWADCEIILEVPPQVESILLIDEDSPAPDGPVPAFSVSLRQLNCMKVGDNVYELNHAIARNEAARQLVEQRARPVWQIELRGEIPSCSPGPAHTLSS